MDNLIIPEYKLKDFKPKTREPLNPAGNISTLDNLIQENARLRYEIALMRVQRAQKDMKQPVLYEQSNIRRVQTIQTTEDHRILFIKGAIDWAIQHPKETTAIAAGVTVAGLVFMWLDSKNN